MVNNEWRISENPAPDVLNDFIIMDTSEPDKLLNDTNIWQVVDYLIGMGLITSAATVHSTTPAQNYEVERPVQE
jgi:hypothetical protein